MRQMRPSIAIRLSLHLLNAVHWLRPAAKISRNAPARPGQGVKGDLNYSLPIALAWQHAFPGEDLTRELSASNAECFFSIGIVSVSPLR